MSQNIQIRIKDIMLEIMDKTPPKVALRLYDFIEELLYEVIESKTYFITFKPFLTAYFFSCLLC